jgi:hypothetical protein
MEFEEIRREIEQKQQIIHPRDPRAPLPDFYTIHAEKGLSASTSIGFGIFFLLLAAGIFAVPFLRDFEGGSVMAWLLGLGPLLLAVSYFRGAARRMRQKNEPPVARERR